MPRVIFSRLDIQIVLAGNGAKHTCDAWYTYVLINLYTFVWTHKSGSIFLGILHEDGSWTCMDIM